MREWIFGDGYYDLVWLPRAREALPGLTNEQYRQIWDEMRGVLNALADEDPDPLSHDMGSAPGA